MIAIRPRWTRTAALVCLLALTAGGCGLSAELDRERNPERRPTPTKTRAVPPPAPTSPEPSPAVAVQREHGCPPSGLRVGTGSVDGAMGLRAMTLTLTNCGKRTREMNGYPTVRVLDETGAPLTGVHTAEGTGKVFMAPDSPRPEPFKLRPGETAHATLYWRMAAEHGTYLRVAPDEVSDAVNVRPREPLDIGPENTLGTTAWALES
ncbi:DUF4232 domain-containing protein [Streptomyces sp. NPDC058246]|uniref:DUF4232 domain-containing protein n=1 Tax=Streptomyces sp. NPDC058246 TaxID=3346400 RepID=UPI0036E5A88E